MFQFLVDNLSRNFGGETSILEEEEKEEEEKDEEDVVSELDIIRYLCNFVMPYFSSLLYYFFIQLIYIHII